MNTQSIVKLGNGPSATAHWINSPGDYRQSLAPFLVCIALVFSGCAGGSAPPPPSQAVVLTALPVSQVVPIGDTATFSVTATGTGPLQYQWSENGAPIAGATSATYTTQPVALSADGSTTVGTFQVTVSNSVDSVTSKAVTLAAGPRSPKAGDLRYLLLRQVSAPGLIGTGNGSNTGVTDYPTGTDGAKYSSAVGDPLGLGSNFACAGGICAWQTDVMFLPPPMTGLTMYYQGGLYSNFASDMRSFLAPNNVVIISLDFETPENYYALAAVQSAQPGGFDYRLEVVPPSQIQATAAADGQESRIITAVTFDASGNANLISYGWKGDTTTVYEAQVATVPPGANVCEAAVAAAQTLAGEGYFISGFGGNDTNGYVLVGMRVQGDSLPRPIEYGTKTVSVPAVFSITPPYFTTVLYMHEFGDFAAVNEQ